MLRTWALLAGLIAILVIGNSGAESKRRSAQPQIQAPSANPTQPRASDQRGTDQAPFAIKVIPSETAKDKADREERERRVKDEKAAIDKRLADETQRLADETGNLATYTRWLDGITVFLFIAAVVQIGLFVWQLGLIRDSLGHTKKAAEAADESAKVARVSADGFMNAERPYIYISRIDPLLRDRDGENYPGIRVISIVELKCIIKNYGRTPAIFKQISSQLRLSKDDPAMTLSIIPEQFLIIERNGTHSFDVPMGYELNEETAKMLQTDKISFWLHFSFIYRDVFGNPHETAGRWSYNVSSGWNGEYEKAT